MQNKRLIAKQLDVEIDAFIFLLGVNPRMDINTQKIFSILHEWTLGRVWNNLIFAYGRTTFDEVRLRQRAMDDKNFIADQMEKLEEIKTIIMELADREDWHIRFLDGQDKKMVKLGVSFTRIIWSLLVF